MLPTKTRRRSFIFRSVLSIWVFARGGDRRLNVRCPYPPHIRHIKSQNGNMSDEYAALAGDAGRDGPAFAREYFGELSAPSSEAASLEV